MLIPSTPGGAANLVRNRYGTLRPGTFEPRSNRRYVLLVLGAIVVALALAGAPLVLKGSDDPQPQFADPGLAIPWPTSGDPASPTATPAPLRPEPTATATRPAPPPRKPPQQNPGRHTRPRPAPPPPFKIVSEAESSVHDFTGNTRPDDNPAASGGWLVRFVGNGSSNTLRLSVRVPDSDVYAVTFFYISADWRQASIVVNDRGGLTADFPPTGDWSTVRTLTVRLALRAGANTIALGNPWDPAPDFDRFVVAR